MKERFDRRKNHAQRRAQWFVMRLYSGDMTAADESELHRWLAEDPGHRQAYEHLLHLWDLSGDLASDDDIAALAQDADVFFCESPFLDADADQATRRYHLTAKQAGLLGRSAHARKLRVFHFSPRYAGRAEELYREAQASFCGESLQAEPHAAGTLTPAGK